MVREFKSLLLIPIMSISLMACQTAYQIGDAQYGPAEVTDTQTSNNADNAENNAAGYVPAEDYLGPDLMEGDLYQVSAEAWNDGYTNTYEIKTEDNVYYAQGTENAEKRIHEIRATHFLSKRSVPEAIGISVGNRGKNLVETPIRAFKGGMDRSSEAEGFTGTLLVFRTGIVGVLGNLANGIKEIGVTGLRITGSAAGTRCSGIGSCVGKAGKDAWSGLNSITGKHAAANRIHLSVGTDPYTDNEVLQKEVSRIAYADAYTGLSFKIAAANAGIPFFSPYSTGVGYYNNVEFLAQYEDAEKRRDIEKEKLLAEWDVEQSTIDGLYNNPSFTHTTRTQLLAAMEKVDSPEARIGALGTAADSDTRYVAENKVAIYQYLADLDEAGELAGFVEGSGGMIAATNEDSLILPFKGDYISWTDEIAAPITNFAALVDPDQKYSTAEIHVLGLTSPLFKEKVEALGLKLLEIR
jgi:hypothetical protein